MYNMVMKKLIRKFSHIPLIVLICVILAGCADLSLEEDIPKTNTPQKRIALCSNNTLFLEVAYDMDIWTCESVDKEIERSYMDFSSETVEIRIGDLPRGFYCGEGIDPEGDAVCSTEDYPLRDDMFASVYKLNGEAGEIFGGVNIGSGSSISITWTGMENRDLTELENKDLLDLLDGVSSIGGCSWPCQ